VTFREVYKCRKEERKKEKWIKFMTKKAHKMHIICESSIKVCHLHFETRKESESILKQSGNTVIKIRTPKSK
jgi:hypothetical protein